MDTSGFESDEIKARFRKRAELNSQGEEWPECEECGGGDMDKGGPGHGFGCENAPEEWAEKCPKCWELRTVPMAEDKYGQTIYTCPKRCGDIMVSMNKKAARCVKCGRPGESVQVDEDSPDQVLCEEHRKAALESFYKNVVGSPEVEDWE